MRVVVLAPLLLLGWPVLAEESSAPAMQAGSTVSEISTTPEPVAARGRCGGEEPRIRSVGADIWAVDRALWDSYTNLKAASRLAVVDWHRGADGNRDGFSIRKVRCTSPLYKVGFRKGDVIHTINGHPVRSVPGGFAAVLSLGSKNEVQVELTRAGVRKTVRFQIE